MTRAMLWATGLLLFLGTAWGFLEVYSHAPRFPIMMIFPAWCAAWGADSRRSPAG